MEELVDLCLEHVRRSRMEPGCLTHAVHRDVEDDMRLVFLERWVDADAVRTHFAVPASIAFVGAVTPLSAEPPSIQIYESEESRV